MRNSSFGRLKSFLNRYYPLPHALFGYAFGILVAAFSSPETPAVYQPLPFKNALTDALSAELPFLAAAALPLILRSSVLVGKVHLFLRAACFGLGAMRLVPTAYPSIRYFQYVIVSLTLTALYTCLFRQATIIFENKRLSAKQAALEYAARWLFYSGSVLLLLPFKYITGF